MRKCLISLLLACALITNVVFAPEEYQVLAWVDSDNDVMRKSRKRK